MVYSWEFSVRGLKIECFYCTLNSGYRKGKLQKNIDWVKYVQVEKFRLNVQYTLIPCCKLIWPDGLILVKIPRTYSKTKSSILLISNGFYEIHSNMWVRNGMQIRGQAMTFIQNHFYSSFSDADLFLIQCLSSKLDSTLFMNILLERFHTLRIIDILLFIIFDEKQTLNFP